MQVEDYYECNESLEYSSGILRTAHGERGVRYAIVDGYAVIEGDIIIGTAEELKEPPCLKGHVITAPPGNRWPGGVLKYMVADDLTDIERVVNAIKHWESKTSIRFEQISNKSENHVLFKPGSGCSSYVGMVGKGRQPIILHSNCSAGNVIHEIGHALGLWHEHTRLDRDSYITVNWKNIKRGKEHNFEKHRFNGMPLGPYDYGSIMHYSTRAFSKNSQPTITVHDSTPTGQRKSLSVGDIAAIGAIYEVGQNDLNGVAAALANPAIRS